MSAIEELTPERLLAGYIHDAMRESAQTGCDGTHALGYGTCQVIARSLLDRGYRFVSADEYQRLLETSFDARSFAQVVTQRNFVEELLSNQRAENALLRRRWDEHQAHCEQLTLASNP